MKPERREPTFGGAADSADSTPTTAASSPSPKPQAAPVVVEAGLSKIGLLGFLLAVVASAAAAVVYLDGQNYRKQAQAELAKADARIAQLEKRLDFTDEESSQSVEAIRAKLKWADSEIRKL